MKQFWLISWILILPGLYAPGEEISQKINEYQKGRVKDILVLSVAGETDSLAAIGIEKAVANELNGYNYAAESAIEHFGKNAFVKIREEETIKQLYPYDAVIIVALVNENQKKVKQVEECDSFFWEYYDKMYTTSHTIPVARTGKYYWEVSFFEISNWKLQYRMKTLPFPFSQAETKTGGYGKLITRDMLRKGTIHRFPEKLKPF